jgi:hypothetical protein
VNALLIIDAARAAGVTVSIDGDNLLLRSGSPPPQAVIDALSRHKREVIDFLRSDRSGRTAQDWRAFFDERAAITEFRGGFLLETPRIGPSPPASSSGSTATQFARRRTAAAGAAAVSAKRTRSFRLGLSGQAMPGCTVPVGDRGTSIGKLRRSIFSTRSGSLLRSSFQEVSQKTETRNGRLRVGKAKRIGACQSGRLSLARREPPPSRRLPTGRMVRHLAMDAGRRASRLDQSAR